MISDNKLINTLLYNYTSETIAIVSLAITLEFKGKIKLSQSLDDFSFLSVQMNKHKHFNLDHVRSV